MKSCLITLVAVFLVVSEISVASGVKYSAPPPEFFKLNPASKTLIIAAGDVLTVRFYFNPELNKTLRVREDGKISLDFFQGIQVAGQTPEQLQKTLIELYSKEFTKPEITVDVDSPANNSAFVTGEVLLPGTKEVRGKMTVAMILAMSQVNQKTASTKSVFLIRGEEEGEYLVYKLDASLPSGTAGGIQVVPGDILFVPRKGIVKANDIIEQYIRNLLPVSTSANAGIYYTTGTSALNTVSSGR